MRNRASAQSHELGIANTAVLNTGPDAQLRRFFLRTHVLPLGIDIDTHTMIDDEG